MTPDDIVQSLATDIKNIVRSITVKELKSFHDTVTEFRAYRQNNQSAHDKLRKRIHNLEQELKLQEKWVEANLMPTMKRVNELQEVINDNATICSKIFKHLGIDVEVKDI